MGVGKALDPWFYSQECLCTPCSPCSQYTDAEGKPTIRTCWELCLLPSARLSATAHSQCQQQYPLSRAGTLLVTPVPWGQPSFSGKIKIGLNQPLGCLLDKTQRPFPLPREEWWLATACKSNRQPDATECQQHFSIQGEQDLCYRYVHSILPRYSS